MAMVCATTVVAPERSREQRLEALRLANEVRSRRARLKRDLKVGRADVVGLVERPPEWLESMKVLDLLLATPKVGRVKAAKVLRRADASPSKTLGGLSSRQRGELVVLLRSGVIPPPAPRVVAPRLLRECVECGAELARPTVEGLCGFCERGLS